MKEPWETRQGATPKSCRPCPTDLESFRKFKKIKANKETQLKKNPHKKGKEHRKTQRQQDKFRIGVRTSAIRI